MYHTEQQQTIGGNAQSLPLDEGYSMRWHAIVDMLMLCMYHACNLLLHLLQGSRIVQRYIDYKKLQHLMKDISGFSASQRMEGGQPMTHIEPKQVSPLHNELQQARCRL